VLDRYGKLIVEVLYQIVPPLINGWKFTAYVAELAAAVGVTANFNLA
jgi:hypothetical protein